MEDDFVYCNNIQSDFSEMGLPEYNPDEWRLFNRQLQTEFEMCVTS